jgi:hypothetical protein
MHRFATLTALFIIFGCTVPKAAKVAAPATAAPAPESVSAKIVDRGAETSRAIDGAGTPRLNSADPAIHAWQLSVIEKLKPYMRWPDDAPYWIDTAAPVVRVTITGRDLSCAPAWSGAAAMKPSIGQRESFSNG